MTWALLAAGVAVLLWLVVVTWVLVGLTGGPRWWRARRTSRRLWREHRRTGRT